MRVGLIGINHKIADLRVREALAKACQRRFSPERALHINISFVLLSTCNRTEIYFCSEDLAETHSYILGILKQEISFPFEHLLYSYFQLECFLHLAKVTTGLDSAILIETEIQGQVRTAYEHACHYNSLSKELHFLFQKSLKVGKDVRSLLPFERGMPGLEDALFQIGSGIFSDFLNAHILFVGASLINLKILKFFQQKKVGNLSLCNRTPIQPEGILHNLNWHDLKNWPQFEMIIFATKSPSYLIKPEDLQVPLSKKCLLIDLSVPRNVDPRLAKMQEIVLLNIDQINSHLKVRKQKLTHLLSAADEKITQEVELQLQLFHERERRSREYALAN